MAVTTIEPPSATPGARGAFASLLRRPSAIVSLGVLSLAILCALVPDWVVATDPYAQSLATRLRPPSWLPRGDEAHFLGTDHLGRDILARIVHGARITLLVSLLAVAGALVVGVAAGLVAGSFGGRVDAVIMRLTDIQLAFPVILLVIVMVAMVGPSLVNVVIILALSGWPRFARIVRGSVLTVRELEFVQAAVTIGASRWRIMARHLLPNVSSAVIVYASFEVARMILLEATLSFLGLGVQPPTPTWGGMINDGRQYLHLAWNVSVFPGIAIALVILAVNIFGDDLRDALDPQLSEDR